jgi:hypothetical protein
LLWGDHFVGVPGEKIDRQEQPREVDWLTQSNELAGGKLVALVQFLDDLDIINSRKINRPCIPIGEDGFQPRKLRRANRFRRL